MNLSPMDEQGLSAAETACGKIAGSAGVSLRFIVL
jgi:hypothetical protein